MVDIASRADSEQWLVHDCQILLSTERAWNKEGVDGSQRSEVATVSLARGVFGGERRARIETEREQFNAGDIDAAHKGAFISRMPWNSYICTYNSLDLLLNSFSSIPFVLQNLNQYAHIFSFFSRCTTLKRSNTLFLFTKFIIYIKIWHKYSK